ncbi:type I polyketide synthase [Nostoc sp. WHI]|uniref:type I polyketide synthase n=1 Tax=Nostoc sp. WHI TaxID=2650611 RepID=UPI0018C5A0F2|nr:type I polyketide synthase [Nostoc sp. WHI]MBG1270232.1 SDR family NAD(P)-dependent oxidoreductase [Nostoc sp. WHI]
MDNATNYDVLQGIAIIGMAGRFPGAKNIAEFWHNLRDGVESVTTFTDAELIAAGVDKNLLNDPNYVKAGAILEDIDLFDASFFGFNPKEAEITDPQHRLFLQCAWEALENAGYDSSRCESRIGVYGGASLNNYLSFNDEYLGSASSFQKLIGNDKDYLTTRVSYKLNLSGPSITIQTACSTSLVAISLACQSLLNYQCDMALAGGVSIRVPQKTGYLYQEGGILSTDGHCRAFDANARGTIIGNGVGIVVLKRLADAIADRDCIHAIIKGAAINNDGATKVGYTAPSVNGQAEAVAEALTLAGVEPETITYIEAHGTGTSLGDPIEIAALTSVFRADTDKKGYCAIGSVKTNIGHLDAAAGVTGVIKTVLALKHKLIPPSLNFEQPNPEIDFKNSPFYVNTQLKTWKAGRTPRRAGVSSLGIGGTNAHVILEEAPSVNEPESRTRDYHLLLSAKTDSALKTTTKNLAQHLRQYPEVNLADVAYTLQVGRREFNHRCMVIAKDSKEAATLLESPRVFMHCQEDIKRAIVFMFPGQGAQYVNMAKGLYESESGFREQVDYCAEFLKPLLKLDLRHILYPDVEQTEEATQKLQQTEIAQPALFVIEYALAQLWMSWGVEPQAAIGHSIGEYVAACLAGVFSLKEALILVAKRGQLMQQLPKGAMLAVSLPAADVQLLLNPEFSLAASNAPSLSVVSGTTEAIANLQNHLNSQGIVCRLLHTSHAFHSQMMNPIIEEFTEQVRKVNLKSPEIPFISNVTGTWITATEATNPNYWARHLWQTVQFNDGVQELLKDAAKIWLEVGPNRTLSTLVKQHSVEQQVVFGSSRHPQESQSDVEFLLNTLGQLWLAGVQIDWSSFYAEEKPYRIPLPTYPFERQRYWIESPKQQGKGNKSAISNTKKPDIADWFYIPSWKQTIALQNRAEEKSCWLIFSDRCGVGKQIEQRLTQANDDVITVIPGEEFTKLSDRNYMINPRHSQDYDTLLQELKVLGKVPNALFTAAGIAHLWSLTQNLQTDYETSQYLGFYSLLFLAQAIGNHNLINSIQITVVSNNIYDITGAEQLSPQKATISGCCQVIPQEYPNIICRSVDIVIPSSEQERQQLIEQLILELKVNSSDSVVAYRGKHRWLQNFDPVRLEATNEHTPLKEKGVYLITGGLGSIGLVIAEYLAKTVQARLILVGRSGLPSRQQWSEWLSTNDEKDPTSLKIQKVQALEKLGAEVQVISADVTNLTQMQQAIAETLEKFGQLNGVIHAAGIAGGGMIQLKTPEIAAKILAPKVQGTLVLAEVLKNQDINLDFLVLCSSLSAILGEFGQVDYCAANTFLDTFAHQNTNKTGLHTVAINWDVWQDIGMAINPAVPHKIKQQLQERLKQGIISAEGVNVFSRILGIKTSQIVVSTQDLQAKFSSKALLLEEIAQCNPSESNYKITRERENYLAPENEIEQQIADIWQELLGIEQISGNDNFFELGGHSLLAVQILSRLREKFSVELTLRTLLSEAPTIAELAKIISDRQSSFDDSKLLENLLAEIENLSITEIQKQLTEASNLK